MVEVVIKYLVATFQNSMPEISDVNGLAEKINEDPKQYPAIYCGKDDFKHFQGEDNYLYFRQTGPATEDESEEESVSGCDEYVKRTYPMIAVAYIPKDIYNTDNAYIDSKVSNNIANVIREANYGTLNAVIQSEVVYAEITSIQTDRNTVWAGEYSGIEMAARHDHVLCAIEFNVVIEATQSCFKNFDCNDEEVVVDGDTITVLISDSLAWHRDGDIVLGVNKVLGSTNAADWDIIRGGVVVGTVKSTGIDINGNIVATGNQSIGGTSTITGDQNIGGNLIVAGSIDYGSGAIQSLNGLTAKTQTFPTFGTTGTTPNVVSSGSTHTFNFPLAGSGVTSGTISNAAQTIEGAKVMTSPFSVNLAAAAFTNNAAAHIRGASGTVGNALQVDDGEIIPNVKFRIPNTGSIISFVTLQVNQGLTTNSDDFIFRNGTGGQLRMAGDGGASVFISMRGSANSTRPSSMDFIAPLQTANYSSAGLVIGSFTHNASAILEAVSTTKGFLPPKMTTAQKNAISSPSAGLIVYDTSLNKLCVYTSAWETITSV